jgi:hypothetical protein
MPPKIMPASSKSALALLSAYVVFYVWRFVVELGHFSWSPYWMGQIGGLLIALAIIAGLWLRLRGTWHVASVWLALEIITGLILLSTMWKHMPNAASCMVVMQTALFGLVLFLLLAPSSRKYFTKTANV